MRSFIGRDCGRARVINHNELISDLFSIYCPPRHGPDRSRVR
ncbi:hypothetical protein [Tengunoibacter tsumagoiensis]|nr:hypothetical protein [Tengunoibacter tsumagoiensis]